LIPELLRNRKAVLSETIFGFIGYYILS
jgi:hypothetical protein